MRKFAVIGTTVALLAGSTAAMSIASASAAPKNAATPAARVLHLLSQQKSLKVIDLGKKGPSPGDQVLETTIERQNGKPVARGFLNCTGVTVTARGFDVLCHGTLIFRDGQVELGGETNFHEPFTVGITGGTGVYQNAGGQITVERTLPDGTTDVETLRLVFFETG
jgi:hypothetical protein